MNFNFPRESDQPSIIHQILQKKKPVNGIILLIFFSLIISAASAQYSGLKTVDTASLKNWPVVWGPGLLARDGKYAAYYVNQSLAFPFSNPCVAYIKELSGNWSFRIDSIKENSLAFTEDSKFAVYKNISGSVYIHELGRRGRLRLLNIKSHKLVRGQKDDFLIYKDGIGENTKCLNIRTRNTFTILGLVQYLVLQKNNSLLAICNIKKKASLKLINLFSGEETTLYSSNNPIEHLIGNSLENLFVFTNDKKFYLYDVSKIEVIKINLNFPVSLQGLVFDKPDRFIGNGTQVLINFFDPLKSINNLVNDVKIFSYQDSDFFSVRMESQRLAKNYHGLLDLPSGRISRLEFEGELLKSVTKDGKFAVINRTHNNSGEQNWNSVAKVSFFLLNLETGKRRVLDGVFQSFSPDSRWIIKTKGTNFRIFSENLLSGKEYALTEKIISQDTIGEQPNERSIRNVYFGNWLNASNKLICFDKYDIWLLDPSGGELPMNITNGFGRKHHLN